MPARPRYGSPDRTAARRAVGGTMPVVWLVVTVAFALVPQPPRPTAGAGWSGLPDDRSGLIPETAAGRVSGLPGGIAVSRPLTPVYDPAGWPSVTAATELNPVCRLAGPAATSQAVPSLGSSWLRGEYLLWWPPAPPVPPPGDRFPHGSTAQVSPRPRGGPNRRSKMGIRRDVRRPLRPWPGPDGRS